MNHSEPPPSFRSVFVASASPDGSMPFDRFMELALYHPQVGYYRRSHRRIGYAQGTDFFTAATSGKIFGELILAACTTLLGSHDASEHTFIEVGSETRNGVLEGVEHPFKRVQTFRLGEKLELSGHCVVFSNELFDAQPFRRFVGRNGKWNELGVALRGTSLVEVEYSTTAPSALPADVPEGYVIDAPFAAAALTEKIAAQPWKGLFVACDYGKSWRELADACPEGTARAYFRHTQSNQLLARPGEQDLTCHICWDWLIAALERHHFKDTKVETQESFFIRNAAGFIAATASAEAPHFSPRKASLLQLLHPAHLGQKFQVLHSVRE